MREQEIIFKNGEQDYCKKYELQAVRASETSVAEGTQCLLVLCRLRILNESPVS